MKIHEVIAAGVTVLATAGGMIYSSAITTSSLRAETTQNAKDNMALKDKYEELNKKVIENQLEVVQRLSRIEEMVSSLKRR